MTKQIEELITKTAEMVKAADKHSNAFLRYNLWWYDGYLSALMDLDLISVDRFDDLIDEMQNKCGIK